MYEPLQRYIARRSPVDEAGDVFAETLLVVWRRLDQVPDDPLPWCYGVARRCLANHRRASRRGLRLVERVGAEPPTYRASQGSDPQLVIESSDPELEAAIDELTASEAEIVRLWAWERLEPREIAVVLGTTPNAVSVALTRAKRKLADRLEHQHRQNAPAAGHKEGADAAAMKGDQR